MQSKSIQSTQNISHPQIWKVETKKNLVVGVIKEECTQQKNAETLTTESQQGERSKR
jgi:hypothetical protein